MGFTLAEVLITLVIIGVIAALTVPNMIIRHQKLETATRVKNVYSELSQVIRMSEANNGPMSTWDFGTTSSVENTRNVMQKYLLPYFRNINEYSTGSDISITGLGISWAGINYVYNGTTAFSIAVFPSEPRIIFFTVAPNTKKLKKEGYIPGKTYFYFQINNGKIIPFGYMEGKSREDIINGYTYDYGTNIACNKSGVPYSRYSCTFLLMFDGWQIKDDYPW